MRQHLDICSSHKFTSANHKKPTKETKVDNIQHSFQLLSDYGCWGPSMPALRRQKQWHHHEVLGHPGLHCKFQAILFCIASSRPDRALAWGSVSKETNKTFTTQSIKPKQTEHFLLFEADHVSS